MFSSTPAHSSLASLRSCAIAAALAGVGALAHAQATITHDKALTGNITPGDSAGYPITISQPGSYKLMSNLVVPPDTAGIILTTSNVTLDLNGFTISGPVTCSDTGSSISCSAAKSGTVNGINAQALGPVTIRNGTVQGFRGYGIRYGVGGLIEKMIVRHNADDGIVGASTDGAPLELLDSRMEKNGGSGFVGSALIARCASGGNGLDGFKNTAVNAMTTQSVANRNYGYGFAGGIAQGSFAYTNAKGNFSSVTSMGGNMDGLVPF